MKRPVGVTVLGVLAIVGAMISLLGALPLIGMSGLGFLSLSDSMSGAVALGSTLGISIGVVMMALAIVQLVFGIGALQLRSWAWTLGVVLYGLTLANYLVSLFTIGFTLPLILGIVVVGVIIAYLYSHDVREAFGHLPGSTSGTPMVTH